MLGKPKTVPVELSGARGAGLNGIRAFQRVTRPVYAVDLTRNIFNAFNVCNATRQRLVRHAEDSLSAVAAVVL